MEHIIDFIKRLPNGLGDQIIMEYLLNERELEYLLKRKSDKYKWIKDVEIVKYLLLLGIFYRKIIDPIAGTVGFTKYVNQLGASGIKVGSVSTDDLKELTIAVQKFEKIMRKFGLDVKFFDFGDVEEFLWKIKNLEQNETNEL